MIYPITIIFLAGFLPHCLASLDAFMARDYKAAAISIAIASVLAICYLILLNHLNIIG